MAIMKKIRKKLEIKDAHSVHTDERGMSVRRNDMFRMIGLRASIEFMALVTESITSWKGTTDVARFSPAA